MKPLKALLLALFLGASAPLLSGCGGEPAAAESPSGRPDAAASPRPADKTAQPAGKDTSLDREESSFWPIVFSLFGVVASLAIIGMMAGGI